MQIGTVPYAIVFTNLPIWDYSVLSNVSTKSVIIANDILKTLESIDKSIKNLKSLDFYSNNQAAVSKLKTELSKLWQDIQRHYSENEEEASTAFWYKSSFPGLSSSTSLENILSFIFMKVMDMESSIVYGTLFEDDNYATYAWQLVDANKSKVNSIII